MTAPISLLLAELAAYSWEAAARRTSMIMHGICTAAEYQRMFIEKMEAAQLSTTAFLMARGSKAVVAPWHRTARANARRLRR